MQTVEELIQQARQLSPQERQRLVAAVEASLVEDVLKRRPAWKDPWAAEMRQVLSEFRKGAEGYSADEIDQIVDAAVETVRSGKRPRKSKARAHAARGARYQRLRHVKNNPADHASRGSRRAKSYVFFSFRPALAPHSLCQISKGDRILTQLLSVKKQ